MNRFLTRILLALGASLVIASVAFLVPLCLHLRQVESEIRYYQATLRDQEMIKPLQLELTRTAVQQLPEGLATKERAPLRSSSLSTLPEIFRAPALQAGLTLDQVSPDVQNLPLGAYQQLSVTVAVSGPSSGFHQYLLALCRLPCLAELRQVTIRRTEPNHVQMTVSAMLSVQN